MKNLEKQVIDLKIKGLLDRKWYEVYIKKWNKILWVKLLNINTNLKVAVELTTKEDSWAIHKDIFLLPLDKVFITKECVNAN